MKKFIGIVAGLALVSGPVVASDWLPGYEPEIESDVEQLVAQPPIVELPVEPFVPEEPAAQAISCVGCTNSEELVADFFFDQGITDKNAVAVLLGAIKQESRFQPSVCEGGAITSYRGCTRGGFGLCQWTSIDRYNGLGQYARQTGQAPESMTTQLGYLVTEVDWKRVEQTFKTPGLPLSSYSRAAYKWLRPGIIGNRTKYAYQYASKLVVV